MANEQTKLATNIGRTKRYLEEGLTYSEIAKKLKVGEATVRSWANMINETK